MYDEVDIALIEFINAREPGNVLREIAERALVDRRKIKLIDPTEFKRNEKYKELPERVW